MAELLLVIVLAQALQEVAVVVAQAAQVEMLTHLQI